jgi:hypothetical protein
VVGCSLGGERWDGEEEGEEEGETEEERMRGRESVGRGNIYWICRRNVLSVTPSVIPPVLAFGCPGLNPSVFSSVNSSEKNPRHPAIAIFKKNFSPPVYTDGIISWVYTGGIADGVFPSAMFTDGNNSVGNAVGVIRFSGSEKMPHKPKIYHIIFFHHNILEFLDHVCIRICIYHNINIKVNHKKNLLLFSSYKVMAYIDICQNHLMKILINLDVSCS